MANPQIEDEDRFTQIPNDVLDAQCHFRIPGEARLVFDCIVRLTYGFHRREFKISNKKFIEKTGLKKQNVCRAIKKLVAMNLIEVNPQNSSYSINENSVTWKPVIKKDCGNHKRLQITSKEITPVIKSDDNFRRTKENLNKSKNNALQSSVNLGQFLEISLDFHQRQKEDGLCHADFKHALSLKTKAVIEGAKCLEKLFSIDGESIEDIRRVLDFIVNDDRPGPGWRGWKRNVVSLASIRKNKNGTTKYFKIKNQIPVKKKLGFGFEDMSTGKKGFGL